MKSRAFTIQKTLVVFSIAVLIVTGVIYFFAMRSDKSNEEIIDEAIAKKNQKLCEKVTQTTRPGRTDAPEVIRGAEAIKWCKQQVEFGSKILGG